MCMNDKDQYDLQLGILFLFGLVAYNSSWLGCIVRDYIELSQRDLNFCHG